MPARLIGEALSAAEERKERVKPIRRSIRVKATPARAFAVFTAEMDRWWPPTHHIVAEGGWGSLLTLFGQLAESEYAAPTMEPQA